ncbi:unnamed protein product [Closterium sp. NIES-65]|nr:unnamed protein product [Closterium sp. NIES-65]
MDRRAPSHSHHSYYWDDWTGPDDMRAMWDLPGVRTVWERRREASGKVPFEMKRVGDKLVPYIGLEELQGVTLVLLRRHFSGRGKRLWPTGLAGNEGDAVLAVCAVARVESAWQPLAYRFEPRLGEASTGLMQVSGCAAVVSGVASKGHGVPRLLTCLFYLLRRLKSHFPLLLPCLQLQVLQSSAEWLTRDMGYRAYTIDWSSSMLYRPFEAMYYGMAYLASLILSTTPCPCPRAIPLLQVLQSSAEWLARDMGYRAYTVDWSSSMLYRPFEAMYYGMAYIAWLTTYKGTTQSEEYVVRAYNGGPGGWKKTSTARHWSKYLQAKEEILRMPRGASAPSVLPTSAAASQPPARSPFPPTPQSTHPSHNPGTTPNPALPANPAWSAAPTSAPGGRFLGNLAAANHPQAPNPAVPLTPFAPAAQQAPFQSTQQAPYASARPAAVPSTSQGISPHSPAPSAKDAPGPMWAPPPVPPTAARQPAYPSASPAPGPSPSQPSYPSITQPSYPSPSQPPYPFTPQPSNPSPSRPPYPSSSQPPYPSAPQTSYPSPSQPPYSSAPQPSYSSPSQPAYPSPSQPLYHSLPQPSYPSAPQSLYPTPPQPPYPSTPEPLYPSISQPPYPSLSDATPPPPQPPFSMPPPPAAAPSPPQAPTPSSNDAPTPPAAPATQSAPKGRFLGNLGALRPHK